MDVLILLFLILFIPTFVALVCVYDNSCSVNDLLRNLPKHLPKHILKFFRRVIIVMDEAFHKYEFFEATFIVLRAGNPPVFNRGMK